MDPYSYGSEIYGNAPAQKPRLFSLIICPGAPECYGDETPFINQEYGVTYRQRVNIWYFGCILTEAVVWVLKGREGLESFRDARREEVYRILGKNALYFHDGHRVLGVVLKALEEFEQEEDEKLDHVIGDIIRMLIRKMVTISGDRMSALDLYKASLHIFRA